MAIRNRMIPISIPSQFAAQEGFFLQTFVDGVSTILGIQGIWIFASRAVGAINIYSDGQPADVGALADISVPIVAPYIPFISCQSNNSASSGDPEQIFDGFGFGDQNPGDSSIYVSWDKTPYFYDPYLLSLPEGTVFDINIYMKVAYSTPS